MLSVDEAKLVVHKYLPEGKIQSFVSYNGLYIFKVFHDDPNEGIYDPFFSVNKSTGEFKDFSPIHDGDLVELTDLFSRA